MEQAVEQEQQSDMMITQIKPEIEDQQIAEQNPEEFVAIKQQSTDREIALYIPPTPARVKHLKTVLSQVQQETQVTRVIKEVSFQTYQLTDFLFNQLIDDSLTAEHANVS